MKSQRVYQFLVVLLLMLPANVFSQQQMHRIGQNSPHTVSFLENFQVEKFQNSAYYSFLHVTDDKTPYRFTSSVLCATPGTIEIIKSSFTVQNLPFFCKKEFQFERTTSIPLRVRLGSLEYVNKLEGKK
jgi:hypothetical protein